MSVYETFKSELEYMDHYLKQNGRDKDEFVRVEVMGLVVNQISKHADGVIVASGWDEKSKEVLIVMSEGHFYAKLSVVNREGHKDQIGFNTSPSKGAEVTNLK
jgi:hypothetical protein